VAAPASSARHELLRELGVEVVVDRHEPDAIQTARDAVGADFAMVANLVGQGRLAASLDVIADGGRAGSIVELAGQLDEAVDRNVTLHGVLVRPGRESVEALAKLAEAGLVRPVINKVLWLEQAAAAHRRVETGSCEGKVVSPWALDNGLRGARPALGSRSSPRWSAPVRSERWRLPRSSSRAAS
jgi:NADPH:quinone reductase-like Zn-dependent oxidoreductase